MGSIFTAKDETMAAEYAIKHTTLQTDPRKNISCKGDDVGHKCHAKKINRNEYTK